MEHYYRKDLRVEIGSMGCRRMWALIEGLPLDSAVRRNGKTWTTERELAARQIDQDASLLRIIAEALGVKFRGPAPEPIRHPDRATGNDAPKVMAKPHQIRAFMARLKGG